MRMLIDEPDYIFNPAVLSSVHKDYEWAKKPGGRKGESLQIILILCTREY